MFNANMYAVINRATKEVQTLEFTREEARDTKRLLERKEGGKFQILQYQLNKAVR